MKNITFFTKNVVRIDFDKFDTINNENIIYKRENGKPLGFDSFVEGMNYMNSYGWEFVQAYVTQTKDSSTTTHWILRKEIRE